MQEILKYTSQQHPDYANMNQALDIITKVVNTVNERRRYVEDSHRLIALMATLEFETVGVYILLNKTRELIYVPFKQT
jgi:hypothetical protein